MILGNKKELIYRHSIFSTTLSFRISTVLTHNIPLYTHILFDEQITEETLNNANRK
jgi:hypothetical protein